MKMHRKHIYMQLTVSAPQNCSHDWSMCYCPFNLPSTDVNSFGGVAFIGFF